MNHQTSKRTIFEPPWAQGMVDTAKVISAGRKISPAIECRSGREKFGRAMGQQARGLRKLCGSRARKTLARSGAMKT